MTDIEKAEKNAERQPLLRATRKKSFDDKTLSGKLFLCCGCFKMRNVDFGENLELAIRGALFAMPISFPFFVPWPLIGLPDLTHATSNHQAYFSSTAVVIYVFTLYKTVGETICFATAGMLGTAMAVLNVWMMFGLIPNGVTPDCSMWVHVIGWTWGLLFTMTILWLNFDILAKMFALSWHMYFWMTFLNPASHHFTQNFGMHLDGPAFKALTMSALGCFFAILAASLPYPLTAMNKARRSSQRLAETLQDSWYCAVQSYAGQSRSLMQEDRLKQDMARLSTEVLFLSGHIENAWWECFGFGRTQKARVFLQNLETKLRESYNRLGGLMYSCKTETYGPRHQEMMSIFKKYLEQVVDEAGQLFELATLLAGQGHLDKDEIEKLSEHKKSTKEAVEELTRKFKETQIREIDSENVDEFSFCLNVCAYGTLAIDYADGLIENNHKTWHDIRESAGILKAFEPTFLLSKTHLQWVFRNAASILISFIVGFCGYSAMIKNYNSGPAETITLLLSTFVGCEINKNMGRVQGVVLGCVFGQMLYALFAWCTWWGYIVIGLTTIVWVFITLFVYYNSPEFGYIGCLMAAFGTKYLLQGCTSDIFQPTGTYYTIINTVVGITFMTIFDLTLTPTATSKLALNALMEAFDMYSKAVDDMFDPSVQNIRFHHGLILDKLVEASRLGDEAKKEPRFYRTPWRETLFDEAVKSAFTIRMHLCVMECGAGFNGRDGVPKSFTIKQLEKLKTFTQVKEDMVQKIAQVRMLLSIFTYEKDGDPFETMDMATLTTTREAEQTHLKDLLNEVTEGLAEEVLHSNANAKIETLEDVMACELSSIVSAIDAQLEHMTKLKHRILSSV